MPVPVVGSTPNELFSGLLISYPVGTAFALACGTISGKKLVPVLGNAGCGLTVVQNHKAWVLEVLEVV
jgi:hypothetical protein